MTHTVPFTHEWSAFIDTVAMNGGAKHVQKLEVLNRHITFANTSVSLYPYRYSAPSPPRGRRLDEKIRT
jgi:hypothetical protein